MSIKITLQIKMLSATIAICPTAVKQTGFVASHSSTAVTLVEEVLYAIAKGGSVLQLLELYAKVISKVQRRFSTTF